MTNFIIDTLLNPEDICNQTALRNDLLKRTSLGKNVVLIGRRNTGKTSILKNDLLRQFQRANPKALAVYVDLMDVASEDDFSRRLQLAFMQSLSKLNPSKVFFDRMTDTLKSLRPSLTIDPYTGAPVLELAVGEKNPIHFAKVLEQIAAFHQTDRAIIIFDEFQDVALVKTLAAKLRRCLQELPADLSIVASGSKAHLLKHMFGNPKAAFAAWGEVLEVKDIPIDEYLEYVRVRFAVHRLQISREVFANLIQQVQGIPEAINTICDRICRNPPAKDITDANVVMAINAVIEERQSILRERLRRYTEKEIHFLRALAKAQPVSQPTKRQFLESTGASLGGVQAMLKRLEDEAMIYRLAEGYVVNDPLLARFLVIT